jgi:serine phosphatase RsbU (regulator of sigma subunit)
VAEAVRTAKEGGDGEAGAVAGARLHEMSLALAREVTAERTVKVLLEHAIAVSGASAGAVGLLSANGTEVSLVGFSGLNEDEVQRYETFPLSADNPMAESIRTGETIFTRSAEELASRFSGLSESRLVFASLAMVPLMVADRPFGALSLSYREPREFDSVERALLSAAAQPAAHALERARLYETQRSLVDRFTFLAEASEVLARSLDLETTLQRFADLASNRLADWCGIELLTEDGRLRNVAVAHIEPTKVEFAKALRTKYPPDPDSDAGPWRVVRTGKSELFPEVKDEMLAEAAEDDEHLGLIRQLGIRSVMIVPLAARGKTLGAITYVSSGARTYTDEDLELAEELARRAALAIDNSMLFTREHDAALRLQRALLPESFPQVDGIEFAAQYAPAGEGFEVGGDFYEVTAMDDGTVSVTIGDVAGRGIPAAAVMGAVRTAFRTHVLDGQPPVEAVRRVDRLLRHSAGPPQMVTAFHLRLDPATGSAEYVRAGHPPALLRTPDGAVEELAGRGIPPLGIASDLRYEADRVEIPPGSLLLLYTDGLIERPGEDLLTSLEQLKGALRQAPADAAGALQALRREFRIDEVFDDVAMLAVATSEA